VPKNYLIYSITLYKATLLPYYTVLEPSSKKTLLTPFISRTAPVMTDGPYTTKLISKQSHFDYPYNTPTKSSGITTENLSVMILFQYSKCSSRTPHTRGTIF